MNKDSRILVLGSRGLVGSALVRALKKDGFNNILTPVREELDLMIQADVENYFDSKKPEYVFMAAAKVGGIHANNQYRADFIYENLTIQNNVFGAAHKNPPRRLLFLGSSCIYPKSCPQPIKEEYLLTGELEKTNEPYAVAKIAGLKTAESFRRQYGHDFISVMPTNLYGPNDNFHPENSHVIPGLIARMQEAKAHDTEEFKVWGTGNPRREFLFVDDMAEACLFLMLHQEELPDFINIGSGSDISIKELAEIIKEKIGYKGVLKFNPNMPDGTYRKLMDCSKINQLGWKPRVSLQRGIEISINHYRQETANV